MINTIKFGLNPTLLNRTKSLWEVIPEVQINEDELVEKFAKKKNDPVKLASKLSTMAHFEPSQTSKEKVRKYSACVIR